MGSDGWPYVAKQISSFWWTKTDPSYSAAQQALNCSDTQRKDIAVQKLRILVLLTTAPAELLQDHVLLHLPQHSLRRSLGDFVHALLSPILSFLYSLDPGSRSTPTFNRTSQPRTVLVSKMNLIRALSRLRPTTSSAFHFHVLYASKVSTQSPRIFAVLSCKGGCMTLWLLVVALDALSRCVGVWTLWTRSMSMRLTRKDITEAGEWCSLVDLTDSSCYSRLLSA